MSGVEVLGRIGPEGPSVFVVYTAAPSAWLRAPTVRWCRSTCVSSASTCRCSVGCRSRSPWRRFPTRSTRPPWAHPTGSTSPTRSSKMRQAMRESSYSTARTPWPTRRPRSASCSGHRHSDRAHGCAASCYGTASDGRENLVTAVAIAAGHLRGATLVPEVTIFFSDVLLRGNRAVKVHADSYRGFASPNLPAARDRRRLDRLRAEPDPIPRGGADPASGGDQRRGNGLRLHPGIDGQVLESVLARPGLRGLVLEAFGAGNGPTESWFLDPLRAAVDRGVPSSSPPSAAPEAWSVACTPAARHSTPPVRSQEAT